MRATVACAALPAIVLSLGVAYPAAGGMRDRPPDHMRLRACAAHDLHLLALIEEHGESGEVAPESLAGTFFAMLRARAQCLDGDAAGAFASYEAASLPMPMRRSLR